jgi:signal transduction histidine kinase
MEKLDPCINLEEAFAQLKVLNETKDIVLAVIGHDLRGPMGSMMQISELLADTNTLTDAEIKQYLGFMKDLSKRSFDLLENLLLWATHNKHALTYNPIPINLTTIVNNKIKSLEYRLLEKNIVVEQNYSGILTAYADRTMIESVIRNLLSNAIKFTPANGKILIKIGYDNTFLKIEIIDNGIGISQENINTILSEDRFYTTFGTNAEKGSGLGLKLCKSFIKLNGGKLQIDSKLGEGSNFMFTLPITIN